MHKKTKLKIVLLKTSTWEKEVFEKKDDRTNKEKESIFASQGYVEKKKPL